MTNSSDVPKAIIPSSRFAETEQAAQASFACSMTLGGQLFNEFFQSIVEQLESNGGLNEEQKATLATYFQTDCQEIVVRCDRLGEFLARVKSEGEAIRNEEKRLAARRAGFEKIEACMRSSIHQQMLDSGVKKAEGKLFSFAIRKNPPKVEITDESAIPPEFVSYEPRIDKRAIKDRLEEGKTIPGARLTDSTRLEIR